MIQTVVAILSRKKENGEDEYLFVSSKKDFGIYTGYYYPPGGEELGVTVKPIKKLAQSKADVQDEQTNWWLCEWEGDLELNTKELADARFFTRAEMEKLKIWPATRNFFEKYIF